MRISFFIDQRRTTVEQYTIISKAIPNVTNKLESEAVDKLSTLTKSHHKTKSLVDRSEAVDKLRLITLTKFHYKNRLFNIVPWGIRVS